MRIRAIISVTAVSTADQHGTSNDGVADIERMQMRHILEILAHVRVVQAMAPH